MKILYAGNMKILSFRPIIDQLILEWPFSYIAYKIFVTFQAIRLLRLLTNFS